MKEKELNFTPSSNWLAWIPHPNKSLCSVIRKLPSDMGWDSGPCLKCESIPRLSPATLFGWPAERMV